MDFVKWNLLISFLVCISISQHTWAAYPLKYSYATEAVFDKRDMKQIEDKPIDLSYEECSNNGICKTVEKFVKELPSNVSSGGCWELVNDDEDLGHLRSKRKVFDQDNALRIRSKWMQRYPFNSAVAIRVGGVSTCSGVAISRSFFLTAAHCLLSPSGEIQVSEIEVGHVLGDESMKWTKVKKAKYHVVWKREREFRKRGEKNDRKYRYDYAVLETVSQLRVSGMTIAVVEKDREGEEILQAGKTFVHFSAFDQYSPNILRYHFCKIEKLFRRKILNKCDTVKKTAGAGVYVRVRNEDTRKVERKVIAIETGDYRKPSKKKVEFSSALRITRRLFVHICFYVTGSLSKCGVTELSVK